VSEVDLSRDKYDHATVKPDPLSRAAVAAALLIHAAVVVWLVFGWRALPAPEPPVMVATLVEVKPPPPPPLPKPEPPPVPKALPPPPLPPPPRPLATRASGPDQQTTAPPPAETRAPKPEPPAPVKTEAPKPAPPPAENETPPPPQQAEAAAPTAAALPLAPPEKPKRPPPPSKAPRKDQLAAREPVLAPLTGRSLGEREETGDPYLNALWSMIERNRRKTTPIGPSGLHLEGITTYEVMIDRAGRLRAIDLLQSSGSVLLDAEARRMIVAAAPFPPLPAEYPDNVGLKVTIRLFPQ
jgi:TonB family protein